MENQKFYRSLTENLIYFRGAFDDSIDFTVRELQITGSDAALLSMEGLVNKQTVAQSILNPIMAARLPETDAEEKFAYIRDNALSTVDQVQLFSFDEAMQRLMSGFAVLAIDGCDKMIAFGVQGFSFRSISEPSSESMQKGSREGFVEPFLINMSMIRRRLKTPDLKFERMTIGTVSQTSVLLCYLRSAVSPSILKRVKDNLHKIKIDTVLAAGYLTPFMEKAHIFDGVGFSERPDTVCGKISEGRIAIIVDGTPNVMIVPFLFVENFQSFDDYASRPFYATFTRWLKFIAFFLAVFLPGFFVAVVTFHPEILPETLLVKIAQAEATTPFPLMMEALVIHLIYEIMREAGLRVPKPLSHAVSIVGALVIGDAAVSSGLIGAPTLMVIALTAISSYVVPHLYAPIAVLRLVFILVGGTMGVWGMMMGACFVLLNLCAENIYGIPASAPISPFSLHGMRDTLIRASWKTLAKQTEKIQDLPGSNAKNS